MADTEALEILIQEYMVIHRITRNRARFMVLEDLQSAGDPFVEEPLDNLDEENQ